MTRKYEYFKVGESPEDSGVTILEHVFLSNQQLTTTYKVRYNCCNTVAQFAHKSIVYRQQRNTKNKGKVCRSCAIVLAQKASAARAGKTLNHARTSADILADYGLTRRPIWPVPNPNLIGQHMLWCDRMTRKNQ